MSLRFDITPGSPQPIYEQIEGQIRRWIATGTLKEGDQLPSVRALAEQLTVNPNTVARAYSELTAEGLVASHAGRGVFIAARRQIYSEEERLRRLSGAMKRFFDETAFLDIPLAEILRRLEEAGTDYFTHSPKP
jgi:GntR family transcriptional regulator